MKRMALFAAVSAAVSLAIGLALSAGGASGSMTAAKSGHHPGGHHDQRILGTWLVDVMPTGEAPFQAMVTFSPGGGLVETESGSPGTALGSWKSLGRRRVAATFQRFEFTPEGEPAGRVVVRTEVIVRRDEFSGPFEFEVFDLEGNVVFSGAGTATATRFPVQPL
jgi:hypothetical protein